MEPREEHMTYQSDYILRAPGNHPGEESQLWEVGKRNKKVAMDGSPLIVFWGGGGVVLARVPFC